MRCELTDLAWSIIRPVLPAKSRSVPRVDDRRVLNGIFWVLRSGAPWRDLPECYGPYTTCYNRVNGIKHCRRIATRYAKLAEIFLAFIKLAAIR